MSISKRIDMMKLYLIFNPHIKCLVKMLLLVVALE